jgi:hypothetical protein
VSFPRNAQYAKAAIVPPPTAPRLDDGGAAASVRVTTVGRWLIRYPTCVMSERFENVAAFCRVAPADNMPGMFADRVHGWRVHHSRIRRCVLVCVSTLVLACATGCGSHSGSQADAAATGGHADGGVSGTGAGGASTGAGGTGGADVGVVTPVDSSVVLADCPELPCLVPAASLTTSCKPSYTCTTQSEGLNISNCFDNGIKVLESWGSGNTPSGHTVMSVKKDGMSCYSVDAFYIDAAAQIGALIYRDGAGAELLTITSTAGVATVACPGSTAVALPSSGPCAVDSAYLGGLMPASSCVDRTTGTCTY